MTRRGEAQDGALQGRRGRGVVLRGRVVLAESKGKSKGDIRLATTVGHFGK